MPSMPKRGEFDPEFFSDQAKAFYEEHGVEPGYGHVILNGRKIPAIHHSIMFDRLNSAPNNLHKTSWFQVPVGETGLITTVQLERSHKGGPSSLEMYTDATHRDQNTGKFDVDFTWGNPTMVEKGPYEGPEHILSALKEHHAGLEEALRSGEITAGPNILSTTENLMNKHRSTDPEEHMTAHWYEDHTAKGLTSIHGRLTPSRNFQFRRLRG